jgi:hypothetical protein
VEVLGDYLFTMVAWFVLAVVIDVILYNLLMPVSPASTVEFAICLPRSGEGGATRRAFRPSGRPPAKIDDSATTVSRELTVKLSPPSSSDYNPPGSTGATACLTHKKSASIASLS